LKVINQLLKEISICSVSLLFAKKIKYQVMNKHLLSFFICLFPFIGDAQTIFTSPSATFIETPSETITDLSFNTSTVDSIQAVINNTRSTYPNNIIRITLLGSFYVGLNPLTLASKTLLVLNYATIWADNNTSATSLIAVPSDTLVSIFAVGNALLNGSNNNLTGINITSSGKAHVDGLTIQNCKKGGIYYSGRGANTYADAGSITRCGINNCGSTGISYNNSFDFICTDNTINNCTLGIHINGNNSAVSNNTIKYCTIGVESVSSYEAITYNTIDSCSTGLSLSTVSNSTLVAHNDIVGNTIGLSVKGTKASIYYNTLSNTQQVAATGTYNELFCNTGLTATQGNVTGCTYFNPPTSVNPHNDLIKVGKTRFDVTITDTTVWGIRGILDSLHNLYSNAVIVVHLNGTFTAPTINDSLIIADDECILLNGTINGTDSCGRLISFVDGCTSSFSGGTINGNNIDGKTAMVYITGTSNVVLDSVSVVNSYGQGIEKKSSSVPTYIRACNLNNIHSRCIWDITSQRLYAFQNTAIGGGKDGIDLDAGSSYCVLQKNICTNNQRNGVFIEEGAKDHIVFGNTLTGSINGVEFYNLAVSNQNSARCLVAYNNCNSNVKGILVSALNSTQASINNVLFNNTCNGNTSYGISGLYTNGVAYNNYVSMNTCLRNKTNNYYSPIDYTNNYFWNMLANPKLLPITFTSFEGKESSNGVLLSWNIVSTTASTPFKIERSNDGVNFTDIGIVNQPINSSFQDITPFDGNNYYRIKAIGLDGSFTYSFTIKIVLSSSHGLLVKTFQSSKGALNVSVSSRLPLCKLRLSVFTMLGKTISTNDYTNLNTTQFTQTISIPSVSKGVYILSVKTDKDSMSKKFEIK